MRSRAAELGVDLSAATVLNPRTSELCDKFADQYAELRKKKGVSLEQAREIIHDVSYFGTMLVHNGIVDGMVSGAAAPPRTPCARPSRSSRPSPTCRRSRRSS